MSDVRIDQAAALCCQLNADRTLSVLLITSRDTGRWVLPKGNIEKNESPHRAAKREALEEAGIVGKVRRAPIGFYSYLKDGAVMLRVSVHVLCVKAEEEEFDECGQREKAWFSPTLAAEAVDEGELAEFILSLTVTSLPAETRTLSRRQIDNCPESLSTVHRRMN